MLTCSKLGRINRTTKCWRSGEEFCAIGTSSCRPSSIAATFNLQPSLTPIRSAIAAFSCLSRLYIFQKLASLLPRLHFPTNPVIYISQSPAPDMLLRKLLRDSRQLRDSYIEISNYFRGQSRVSSRQRPQCLHLSPSPRLLSTSIPRLRSKTVEQELASSGGDVTRGFPIPPDSGFAQGLARDDVTPDPQIIGLEQELDQLGVGQEVAEEPLDSRIPPWMGNRETRAFLAAYKS